MVYETVYLKSASTCLAIICFLYLVREPRSPSLPSNHGTGLLSVLEEVEGRNVLHTVISRELLQLVRRRVHGRERHVLALAGQLVVEGGDHLALAAPRRVKVHNQILLGGDQLLELLLVLDLDDILAHQLLVRRGLRGAAAEVLLAVLRVDRLLAGLPVGGTHLAVLGDELEGLHQTQHLVHAATHGEVVHGDLLDDTLGIDDEQTTKRHAQILRMMPSMRCYVDENAVLGGNLLGVVADDGDLHVAETALLAGRLDPGEMRLDRVARAGEQLRVQLLELLRSVAEGDDFGRTHEGEVLGVEEQHDVLAFASTAICIPTSVILEIHGGDVVIDDSGGLEQGSGLSHESLRRAVLTITTPPKRYRDLREAARRLGEGGNRAEALASGGHDLSELGNHKHGRRMQQIKKRMAIRVITPLH